MLSKGAGKFTQNIVFSYPEKNIKKINKHCHTVFFTKTENARVSYSLPCQAGRDGSSLWGPSHASQGNEQLPWSPPTRCQYAAPYSCVHGKVSQDIANCPLQDTVIL